ncbi:hypothetical protein P9112_000919 [Eukaryota sp. TZLM1-RC]
MSVFKAHGDVPINVCQYIQREKSLCDARAHVQQLQQIANACELDSSADKTFVNQQQKRQRKRVESEVQGMVLYRLTQRRQKLAELYQNDYKKWKAELSSRGLTFISPESD